MSKSFHAADLFCGAGGTSQGFINACKSLNATPELLAVNHWPRAVATHTLNHPGVSHLCETLDSINPRLAVPRGKLDLLCASPECTHHSLAAGGRPKNEQSRATAWHVCRWAEALRIESILIENVREFMSWGPLGKNGKPLKRQKGRTFKAFLIALESLGYRVEHRLLRSADFGDPTSRERLFVMAWRGGGNAPWPVQSHGGAGLPAWRGAREIIDWKLKGKSIFDRKKPLCANTLKRISAGLRKFGGAGAEPFLIVLNGTSHAHFAPSARSVDTPMPALQGTDHIGLCEPFMIHTNHAGGDRCHDIGKPVPTVTGAHRGEMALIEPFIIQTDQVGGNGSYARNIDRPLGVIVSKQNMALVEPMVIGQQSCAAARPVGRPLPTVSGAGAIALVEPFVVKYYGAGAGVEDLSRPLATVTSRDRFMLVEAVGGKLVAELDILFRMLQPHELSAAQGFPADYQFTGTREEQVKQIGNAVTVNLATALCKSLLQ